MTILTPTSTSSTRLHQDLFGANILGYRDRLGDAGTFDDAVEDLGVRAVRYPGGSYTEDYFDIADPDRVLLSSRSGDIDRQNLPYSEFMGWAEAEGISVTIVLPTRSFLSEAVDERGNRYPDFDEAELRQFIRDTLDGVYGKPQIDGFEIGNEYWGAGRMNTLEYGRLASEMAVIIRDEIDRHPEAETSFAETDIAVQVAANHLYARLNDNYPQTGQDLIDQLNEDFGLELDEGYLYADGSGAWPRIQNQILLSEFDTPQERAAIDAVIAHYYSDGDAGERDSFNLFLIEKEWDPVIPGLTRHVTEWNQHFQTTGDPDAVYGLKHAHDMLNMIENMTDHNVEIAHVWAVQQNTRTDLAFDEGTEGLTVAGEMFAMMASSLPGTQKVRLDGAIAGQDETSTGSADAHFFYGERGGVLFLASTSSTVSSEEIDLSGLMSDLGDVTITRLGVEEGHAPNSGNSPAEVVRMDPSAALEGSILDVDLDPFEIMMIEFSGSTATPELEALLAAGSGSAPPIEGGDPDEESDEDEEDEEQADDPEGEGEGGTCFVATAAYGNPYHPDVAWLRAFRDQHLLPHPVGRRLLACYWVVGPRLARLVRRHPALTSAFRAPIALLVRSARGN